MEAIGSLSSTKDGLYLAGGALSGNAYLWEVSKNSIKLPCSISLCKKNFFPVNEKSKRQISYGKFLSISLGTQIFLQLLMWPILIGAY